MLAVKNNIKNTLKSIQIDDPIEKSTEPEIISVETLFRPKEIAKSLSCLRLR
jgi:hypothetical protein